MMVAISRYSVLAFVYTVILACSVRSFFALAQQQRQAVTKTVQRPIRVAMSMDEYSLKDFLIVMRYVYIFKNILSDSSHTPWTVKFGIHYFNIVRFLNIRIL